MALKKMFVKLLSVCVVIVMAFSLVACKEEIPYYESSEFNSLSTYGKLYQFVTREGVSERDLVGQNKKLSDAVTSSLDDYTVAWEYGNGEYSVRYAKLLESVVLKVVFDTAEAKTDFEIFIKEDSETLEFSSTILYKEENIQCASTGVVPENFSSKHPLELETLSGVEEMYDKYKKDSHNACAFLLLNVAEHLPFAFLPFA